jgi:hypothetical protein
MGDLEIGSSNLPCVAGDDVQIERTRPPTEVSNPPVISLDPMDTCQQVVWLRWSVEDHYCVQIRVLSGAPDRFGFIDTRDRLYCADSLELRHGSTEVIQPCALV